MTLVTFQSSLAEIIAGGVTAAEPLGPLADLERRRLEDLARQAGVDVMRTLYFSWRLTKVLSLLPFTTALLGDDQLAERLRTFWQERRATSLYFVEECLAFLEFLEGTVSHSPPGWQDVIAFERARLRLRADQSRGRPPELQRVRFRWDPAAVFAALNNGTGLSEVSACDVVLQGELTDAGQERWTLLERGADLGLTI